MFNSNRRNSDDGRTKRVCGKFLVQFDLDKIFKNIQLLRRAQKAKDKSEVSQIIAKNTSTTKMQQKEDQENADITKNENFKELKLKQTQEDKHGNHHSSKEIHDVSKNAFEV